MQLMLTLCSLLKLLTTAASYVEETKCVIRWKLSSTKAAIAEAVL